MFNNENPYNLRTEVAEGITSYFVSFTDGQGIRRETEVSRPVYSEFMRFVKIERSLRHWDERHREYSDLTDETLHGKVIIPPRSIEDAVFAGLRNGGLRLAIRSLPEIQRRRFVLHHEFGLTYEQIAKMEGCSKVSAFRSIIRAEEKIRKKLKNQG